MSNESNANLELHQLLLLLLLLTDGVQFNVSTMLCALCAKSCADQISRAASRTRSLAFVKNLM